MGIAALSLSNLFVVEFADEILQIRRLKTLDGDQFLDVADDDCVYQFIMLNDGGDETRLRVESDPIFSPAWDEEDMIPYVLEALGKQDDEPAEASVRARLKKIGAIE